MPKASIKKEKIVKILIVACKSHENYENAIYCEAKVSSYDSLSVKPTYA